MRSALAIAVFATTPLVASARAGGDPIKMVEIGARIGALDFVDTRFLPRSTAELGEARALVIALVAADCPVALRYLPRLAALEREYRPRGVRFCAIGVAPADEIVELAAAQVESGCEFPFGRDFTGEVARALGAERTPTVCVLDAERRLVYRGRVDDQHRLGGARPAPGREDLREALEDALGGREMRVAETPVEGCPIEAPPRRPVRSDVDWVHDVAPLVHQNCAGCHRPEGSGPFALLSFEDAAPRARAMAEVVEQGRMPPWFASRRHGEFANDPTLSADERGLILDWVASGAPRGEGDEPVAPKRTPGEWSIGHPDLVLQVPLEAEIPAEGRLDYRYLTLHDPGSLLPHVFAQDTWVQRVEIRPSNPRVLHHANLASAPLGSFERESIRFITGQVPGGDPMRLEDGVAFRIEAGSVLGLEIHYVPTGRPERDRISVGLRFPRVRVQKSLRHHEVHDRRFEIPAGAPAHEVRASRTLECDALGIGMFVHMHLRGRDMVFRAHRPGGATEDLLLVPNYDFDWQVPYAWASGAARFPVGTAIECVAHFDNSSWNPFNPDPARAVRFGRQTDDEMMYGFFFYVDERESLDLLVDPRTGRAVPSGGAVAR